MKKVVCLLVASILIGLSGLANASLTTIGTATYNGEEYYLIWDDDNNGNSLIWLDYANKIGCGEDGGHDDGGGCGEESRGGHGDQRRWDAQMEWAQGLDSQLTYNLYDGYSIEWEEDSWRLPGGVNGTETEVGATEFGHLVIDELGGDVESGDFENLATENGWYWSDTEFSDKKAFVFHLTHEGVSIGSKGKNSGAPAGLAVRGGSVVPIPGAIWLLGSALGCLGVLRRKKR